MGMFSQLKQFKELKEQAKKLQDELSKIEETASAGWTHKVSVTMNGTQDVTKVEIDEALLNDKEKLEDLIKEAVNNVNKKIKKVMAEQMMKQNGGLMGTLNKLKDVEE